MAVKGMVRRPHYDPDKGLAAGILLEMDAPDELAISFQYDLWANLQWLACLQSKAENAVDLAVLGHSLSAQKVWVLRCNGHSLDHMPQVEVSESAMRALNAEWMEVIERIQDNPTIHYRRSTGEALSSTFRDIALHVINHSTYHRGELRGLRRSKQDSDFPETDRIGYTLHVAPK